MSAAAPAGQWPFPGVVWGEYPEKPALQAVGRRGRRTGVKACRAFAAKVLAAPPVPRADLRPRLAALRSRAAGAQRSAAWMEEAFALAACAMAQVHGFSPHPHQVVAARLLLEERLVEMATGEGKTAAIALAAAVAALGRTPVHVVTANDYLARRDAQAQASFYALLDLSVSFVDQPMPADARRRAYCADVAYCTAKELAFDYLRDGMQRDSDLSPLERRARRLGVAMSGEAPVLRGLCMALVDEADTVLIDEAGLPLVLSQPEGGAGELEFFSDALALAAQLGRGSDFRAGASGGYELMATGKARLQRWPAAQHPLYGHRAHREAAVVLALVALHSLAPDRDYVVRDGRIAPVDAATGRAAPGRAWSHGLHQLLELKEGLQPTARNAAVTQITFQRFFPRYLRLAGTSGTLAGSGRELRSIYGLEVTALPPRLPSLVRHLPGQVLGDSSILWQAVAEKASLVQASGRPVLIGTNSVAQSEALAKVLTVQGLRHQVLNARQDAAEGGVIAAAGQAGCITVATSMAGRGTDILLEPAVIARGGLHVILCQHNASRRIDRQFIGRAGRQGQPGSVEILLAWDFPLLQRWCPAWWRGLVHRTGNTAVARLSAGLAQAFEGFTQQQQRVTLCHNSEGEGRDLTFSRRTLL